MHTLPARVRFSSERWLRRVARRCAVAGLVGALALSAGALPANARPSEPTIIPLEPYLGNQSAVRLSVEGHAGLFLFDTGEGVSTVTPAFARSLGRAPWGRITGFRMSGERLDFPRCDNLHFEVGDARFEAPIVGVFDIMSLLPAGVPALQGALGLDIFAGMVITIEPRARRIVVETPQSLAARLATAREVPGRLVRDAEGVALAVDVGVQTPKGIAWMELDNGNGGALVVANHIAPLLGLAPDQKTPQPATFTLVGDIAVSGPTRTRDLIMDGNISNAFLRDWNLTLDLAKGRVWLAPAKE